MVLRSRDTQNNGQAVCVLFVRTATLTTYFGKDGIIRAVHFLPAKMKNGPTPFSAQNLYDLFFFHLSNFSVFVHYQINRFFNNKDFGCWLGGTIYFLH